MNSTKNKNFLEEQDIKFILTADKLIEAAKALYKLSGRELLSVSKNDFKFRKTDRAIKKPLNRCGDLDKQVEELIDFASKHC